MDYDVIIAGKMNDTDLYQLMRLSEAFADFNMQKFRRLLLFAENISGMKNKPENRPQYPLNILDILPTVEQHTSEIIRALLAYSCEGSYPILKSFIEHFLFKPGLSPSLIKNPAVTAENEHIDIAIKDADYAIIIENKLRNAVYQRNQIARYIRTVREKYQDSRIYIVILPQFIHSKYVEKMRTSVWRCPPDWRKPNHERKCACNDSFSCWCDCPDKILSETELMHCRECQKDLRLLFSSHTVVLHNDFAEWLESTADLVACTDRLLKSAILQFTDYIRGLYSTRINDNLLMDILQFLQNELFQEPLTASQRWLTLNHKIQDVDDLRSAMSKLKVHAAKDMIDQWFSELKPTWPELQREVQKSFGIKINGVWVGCWCGSDNGGHPYWGFQCYNPGSTEEEMVKNILDWCDIRNSQRSGSFICWGNTMHGAERCQSFYNAAVELGYLKR